MAEVTNNDVKLPSFGDELNTSGITSAYLIRKLKRELNAKETKVIKIKGTVSQDSLPKGFRIITTSGLLAYDRERTQLFGDGETIIRYDRANMGIRQRAREDTHKLKGDYAPQVLEVEGLKSIADRLQDALEKKAKE